MGQAVFAAVLDEPVTVRPLADYEPSAGASAPRSRLGRIRLRAVSEPIIDARDDGVEPKLRGMIRRLLIVVLEAMDARRPAGQLRDQLTPLVYSAIQTRARTLPSPLVSRIRSIHLCQPVLGVVEVCAVIDTSREVRALAARVEVADTAVRCTALRLV